MSADHLRAVSRLSTAEVLVRLKQRTTREAEATAEVIACVAELDRRRLYLAEGQPSVFAYCTRVLHLSEYAAYTRIQTARIARRFPVVLAQLEAGDVNLTTLGLLAPHLTLDNHLQLLAKARHRTKRQVEELVASVRPLPDVPPLMRKLPDPAARFVPEESRDRPPAPRPESEGRATIADPATPAAIVPRPPSFIEGARTAPQPETLPRAVVAPLAPERYRIQFTAGAGTYRKLLRARDLLRHQIPDGNPTLIFDRALTILLADLARKRFAALSRSDEESAALAAGTSDGAAGNAHSTPGGGSAPTGDPLRHSRSSRRIPAEVKRRVWLRDEGRCAFVTGDGLRCVEKGWLEFHHLQPHALGGPPTPDNLELRCRFHNQYEAELVFGPASPEG